MNGITTMDKPFYSHTMWGKHPLFRNDGKWTAIQTGNLEEMESAAKRRWVDGWSTLILPTYTYPKEPWSVRNPD